MSDPNRPSRPTPRRQALRVLGGAALACLLPAARAAAGPRSLSFYHTHTDERLRVVYFDGDDYVPQALSELELLLRDFRTGERHAIDRRLFDTLHALNGLCGDGTFEIISAYRGSGTNEMLRGRSSGVASGSLHLQGRAIDVRLAGADTRRLRDAALALGRGGVGYYAGSNFVHLDTGAVRRW